jgi:transcriptional regulator with PAS, ATPase and Fis domain
MMFLCPVTQQFKPTGLDVRELENVLERAVINTSGTKLRLVDKLKKPLNEKQEKHHEIKHKRQRRRQDAQSER